MWQTTVKEVLSKLTVNDRLGITLAEEWGEILFDDVQIKLVMGGEGSGKTFHAALNIVCHLYYDILIPGAGSIYWIVGQDYDDARKLFTYLANFDGSGFLQQLNAIGLNPQGKPAVTLSTHKDQQCILQTVMGQEVATISAYDYSKIGREAIQGVTGEEFSRWADQEAFDRSIGRIRRLQRQGSWGFFSGSYESSLGWVPDIIKMASGPNNQGMRAYKVPSWANLYYYPEGRQDPAILQEEERNSKERFMERFGGEPAPPRGVIFYEFRTTQHVDGTLVPDVENPVYLFIDPGDLVYCVLFVQMIDGEARVLDELYVSGWTHEQVVAATMSNPLYGLVKGGTIDIAAKQAHMGMPRPLEEWYKDTGMMFSAQRYAIEDTIERVRVSLTMNPLTGRPRLRIHPRCQGLISEMGGGPPPLPGGGPWMRIINREGFGPPKNKNNHACSALGYGLHQNRYSMASPLAEDFAPQAATYMRFGRAKAR